MTDERFQAAYVPCDCRYPSPVEDPAFQSMLEVWNRVAQELAAAPVGTVADLDGGEYLLMVVVGGKMHMAISSDYEPGSADINVHRPEDFDGIGEEELGEIKAKLEHWLANNRYAPPTDGKTLAKIAESNFSAS